jgi:CRP/FNR family transcriptional regulator, dissimilatory nitrate respiration regulator
MNDLETALATSALFQGFSDGELADLIRGLAPRRRDYTKDEVVAVEGEECLSIGIIVQGSLRVERILPSGKLVIVDLLNVGNSFGEAVLFSAADAYPATLSANEAASVVFLSREEVAGMCARSPRFLNSFLRLLSDKILMLNRKIKTLSFQSVRQKVANYLLEEAARQAANPLILTGSRQAMADLLGIPRPSLSRELAAMQAEGWIDFDRRTVRLLKPDQLAASLME